MKRTKIIRVAGAAAAVGALGLTGTALANAESSPTPTSSSSSGPERPQGAGHAHTPVTGDELAKVTAAVKAEDAAVTVTRVEKDPDGSYDVLGTKAGADVRLEVSKDLTTITTRPGRGPGGPGHGPRDRGTEVTGTEKAKVAKAATAKVPGLTVEEVRKRPDGSYVVRGTTAGAPAFVEVSRDLRTVTERTGRGPGFGHGRGHGPDAGPSADTSTPAPSRTDTT